MRPIPPKLKREMEEDPYYKKCARRTDGACGGRITWEHAIIYQGKQLNEKWAIIPLCERHHAVGNYQDRGDFDKTENIRIALNRATDEELRRISRAIDYIAFRERLNHAKTTNQV